MARRIPPGLGYYICTGKSRQVRQRTEAFRCASVGTWHPQEFRARRENLRRGESNLNQQLERLTEAYIGGVIPLPEYQRRRAEIEARRAALAEQEARLSGEADR